MEPFEKLEIILEGMIKEQKKEVEASRNGGIHPAEPYIQGLKHELIGLQKAFFIIPAIKNNAFGVSDEAARLRQVGLILEQCP